MIQKLANTSHVRESYMKPLEPFVKAHNEELKVRTFCDYSGTSLLWRDTPGRAESDLISEVSTFPGVLINEVSLFQGIS